MASKSLLSLCLLCLAYAVTIRLLPKYLSFQPVFSPNTFGYRYLSIPLSAGLLQQTTKIDDFSISLWYKSNSLTPAGDYLFLLETNVTQGDCCQMQSTDSYLYFSSFTALTFKFGIDGSYYTAAATKTLTVDQNWHFVLITKCKSSKVVRICLDSSACVDAPYKYWSPLTSESTITIGGNQEQSFFTRFNGRIGDMVLYTNTCYGQSDVAALSAKSNPPDCTPLPGFNGKFYDACSEFVQLVSVLFMSSTASLVPNYSTDNLSVSPGASGPFYGRTLSNSFGLAGWVAAAPSSTFLSLSRSNGVQVISLKVTSTSTMSLQWTFSATDLAAVTATCVNLGTYLYFEMSIIYAAGNSNVYLRCAGGAGVSGTSTTLVAASTSDSFTFSGSVYDVKLMNIVLPDATGFDWVTPAPPASLTTHMAPNLVPMGAITGTTCSQSISTGPTCPCAPGSFSSAGLCFPCHPACQQCTGPAYSQCSVCNPSFYMQANVPFLCLSACPTGYNAVGNSCVQAAGNAYQIDVLFENNLLGDMTLSGGQHIQMGWDPLMYYPLFDFLDPFPVQHRGVFFNYSESIDLPNTASQVGSLMLDVNFAVDAWILPYSYGSVFRDYTNDGWQDNDLLIFGISQELMYPPIGYRYYLALGAQMKDAGMHWEVTELEVTSFKKEWMHVGFSGRYDPVLQVTTVMVFLNSNTYWLSFPSFFEDSPTARHNVGFLSRYLPGYLGYYYSISVANKVKTLSDFTSTRGTCSNCVCPLSVNACLPTCTPWQYVDSAGACQNCKPSCVYGCTRITSCNLCEDDLCYQCRTFDAGSCLQCIPGAVMVSNRCTCPSGTYVNNGKCSANCDSGYYLSSVSNQCEPCQRGCVKCNPTDCLMCMDQYYLNNGICSCGEGWYITSAMACAKCNAICKNCMDDKAKCTECYSEQGYVLVESVCVDCRSIEGYSGGQGKTGAQVAGLTYSEAVNAVCQEKCGDSRTMGQLECDDGNIANGDGCSNQCQIEHGWTCTVSTPQGKSICVDNTPPKATLTYIKLTKAGYELSYSFSETVNILQDLSSLASLSIDEGDLFTYSFSSDPAATDKYSPFVLSITASQSYPAGSVLTLTVTDESLVTDLNRNRLENPTVTVELGDAFTLASTTAITTAVTALSGGVAGMAGLGVIISFLGGASLGLLWGLLESIQMVNYLVYMSVAFPDNLRHFLKFLDFANFEFVPNFFDKYASDDFDQPPTAFTKENTGTDTLINIGNMVTIWAITALVFAVILVFHRLFPKVSFIKKQFENFEYATVLRIGTESFLQLALAVLLQLRNPRPYSNFGYFSLITSALLFIYLAFTYAITVFKVTKVQPTQLRDKTYKRKFGSLYEGYRLGSPVTRSHTLIMNSRRFLFDLGLVALNSTPIAQATLLAALTVGFLGILVVFRPYKNRWSGNITEIACESFFMLSQCLIVVFCADSLSISARTAIGWLVILFLSSIIAIHIIVIVAAQINDIMQLVQRCNSFLLRGSILEDHKNKRTSALPEVGKAWVEDDVKVTPLEETKEDTEQSQGNILYPLVVQKIMAAGSGSSGDSPDEAVEDSKPNFQPS